MRMAVFMLSLGLTAWSCASAPRRQPVPVHPAVPATWTVARGRPSAGRVDSTLSAWWSHFQDAQLGALVEESLAHNFDLQAAAGRIDAAQARAKIAGAPLYPQLNLSFNSTRRRQNLSGSRFRVRAGVC